MAINLTDLFTRLGKIFFIQETLNTARGTTIPTPVKAAIDEFDSLSLDLKRAISPLEPGNRNFQSGSASLMGACQASSSQVLIQMVKDDTALDRNDLTHALKELIRQMEASGDDVDASTIGASASAITGNGDGVLVVSSKRGDGRVNENILAETIKFTCTSADTPETATFSARGDAAVSDRLSHDWPEGSGCSRSLQAVDASEDSLIINGGFQDHDDQTNVPDDWICSIGTPGTTIKITSDEVQTITMSGSPTAGTYRLHLTDITGRTQSTAALDYDAGASDVQAAINDLEGFEDVTVSSTGTSPDYTHTVTLTGVAGNIPRIRSTNNTTGGSIAHATTTQGPSKTEVQTVAISGTPTGGDYTLTYTNAAGLTQTTAAIAFDANSATVQAALRLLNELEEITIAESGSTPNFTHTITFTGLGGNLAQLTSDASGLTGGTPVITHGTTTQGAHLSFVGRALFFDSDGSQLTTIQQPVDLEPLSQYAVNLWALADITPAAGVITVDLVDSIAGNVIADQQGTANSFTIDCTALTQLFVAKNGVFRTPKNLPATAFLRIRITTAISNTSSVYLDHCSLVEMTEMYRGGPSAAIFSGKTAFKAGDDQVLADYFTLTTTNDAAGEFQRWFDRNFDMRGKGLLLPSDTGGSETIDDALIA